MTKKTPAPKRAGTVGRRLSAARRRIKRVIAALRERDPRVLEAWLLEGERELERSRLGRS